MKRLIRKAVGQAFNSNLLKIKSVVLPNVDGNINLINTQYVISYSLEHRIPCFAACVLTKGTGLKVYSRPRYFSVDKRLSKEHRVNTKVYTNSGFDRGHLIPNRFFSYNKKLQKETFKLTNIVPQFKQVNRRTIALIERSVVEIQTNTGAPIGVISGAIPSNKYLESNGQSVNIPRYLFIIVISNTITIYLTSNDMQGKSKKINLRTLNKLLEYKFKLRR